MPAALAPTALTLEDVFGEPVSEAQLKQLQQQAARSRRVGGSVFVARVNVCYGALFEVLVTRGIVRQDGVAFTAVLQAAERVRATGARWPVDSAWVAAYEEALAGLASWIWKLNTKCSCERMLAR